MSGGPAGRGAILALLACASVCPAAEPGGPARARAEDLMKRGLYQDAVRVLVEETQGVPEAQCGTKYLMLGESYYMLRQYAEARPYFAKALNNLAEPGSKLVAEYRLACVAYRMGDTAGALDKINAFAAKYPTNERSGVLLLFKMKALAGRGKGAQAEIEAVHRQLQANQRAYGPAVAFAADKVLTDFYVEHDQEEKAKERYASVVHSFSNVIAEYAKDKRPVPASLEQARDHAAMQLGSISLRAKRYDDAVKWLENVKSDPELKRQARLLLAQVAYQKRDFERAISHLTREGFIETVPPGPLRSDMYLLLGLCEKSKPDANPDRVVTYLGRVGQGSDGYFQAQVILGELYRERGLLDLAILTYEKAIASPKYEPQVLFWLGKLYFEKAGQGTDKARQDPLYRKAAEKFSQLTTKYPASQLAKQASETIDALIGKGFDVSVTLSDTEMARRWEQTAYAKPGSAEAARSLINLARLHHRSVLDAKGEKFIKAPNYAACAAACDRLLDGKVYAGKDFAAEQWRDLCVEALYYRGVAHLASATAVAKEAPDPAAPTYLKAASLGQALRDFTEAKGQVEPKRLDLVKNIELGLLEAMFKSDQQDLRERARTRFAELVNEYGSDVRFQKLAMELAEWYRAQGQYAAAAREYKGVAERGANLAQDDRLKALFLAGKLYSKAAYDAKNSPGETRYGIYVHPKEVFKLPDLLKSYRPLQTKIAVKWPERAKDLSAEDALRIVSEASGVPFVWSPDQGQHSVAEYLRRKRLKFQSLSGAAEEFLRQILDLEHQRLVLDIGITGGKPTIALKPVDREDPEAAEAPKTIEVYDERRGPKRFRPLARDYGSWRNVHPKPAMLYNVIQRIEEISGTKVLWADGVEKGDVLGTEYSAIPKVEPGVTLSCAEVLAALLAPLELRYSVVPRDRSAELYEDAKDCFNQIRQTAPSSRYGEKALFLVALNYYHQEDYERMKTVLKEYLKFFDGPQYEHHHQACFWVGWAFEREKRYRDACRYYARAAEEGLVVFKPGPAEKRPARDELKALLSYDTRLALEEPVNGSMKSYALAKEFVDFVRLNANVTLRIDPSAAGIETPIDRPAFKQVPVFDILYETLDKLGLSFRVENVNPSEAERAYYRMASASKKDDLMEQALASLNVLLGRYPGTSRKKDAFKLKLDIYKGLKDYRNVLATLERFKAELADQIEPYKIDFEIAWIYFDLCRYDEGIEHFKKSLAAAKDPQDRINIRDGYARALFRKGDLPAALVQYQALVKEDPEPLHAFVDKVMAWVLERVTTKDWDTPLPPDVSKLVGGYEDLRDEQRAKLSAPLLAKVTWVYYASALADLAQGRADKATVKKLEAAGNSPDDWLAAEALCRLGELYRAAGKLKEAKESFEYLLFSTKSPEAEVRATYALGLCLEELGQRDVARARFEQLLRRFPDSAYADKARAKLAPESRK